MGLLQLADHPVLACAGEAAAAIAEQLALDQRFWNGRAIDRHKRLARSGAGAMQRRSESFFAGTGFAL
ncbi:hypothetical protein D3C87_1213480 [compost metagenome]